MSLLLRCIVSITAHAHVSNTTVAAVSAHSALEHNYRSMLAYVSDAQTRSPTTRRILQADGVNDREWWIPCRIAQQRGEYPDYPAINGLIRSTAGLRGTYH